ncbi:MAG: hypothetical protein IJN50_03920 [Clostridia bacterium]|nr:hypothetical protein [Clostridia bacterium]
MDLYKDVATLKINSKLANQLKQNNINNIYELCHYSRMELGKLGIPNTDINNIMVQLQLLGLNLKSNHAIRNTLIDK